MDGMVVPGFGLSPSFYILIEKLLLKSSHSSWAHTLLLRDDYEGHYFSQRSSTEKNSIFHLNVKIHIQIKT